MNSHSDTTTAADASATSTPCAQENVTTSMMTPAAVEATKLVNPNLTCQRRNHRRRCRSEDATREEIRSLSNQAYKEGDVARGASDGAGGPPPKKIKQDLKNLRKQDQAAARKSGFKNNESSSSSTIMPRQPQAGKSHKERKVKNSCDTTTAPNITTKAIEFVERICKVQPDIATDATGPTDATSLGGTGEDIMSLVSSKSSLVRFAERMFALQEEFRLQGRPTIVDIGYHYTETENMPQIRLHGLLTQADRTAVGVTAMKTHGSTYGDGVYTASNPVDFHGRYGAVGILVARLKGQPSASFNFSSSSSNEANATDHDEQQHTAANCYDSSSSSSSPDAHSGKRVIALRKSAQCLALYSFPATAISTTLEQDQTGNNHVFKCHSMIQAIVDDLFNDGVATELESQNPPPAADAASNQERERIRHKQQRLLLLHHAAKCTHATGRCTVTPHCDSMKQLWQHIQNCKNLQCTVQFCVSSRYVLNHYQHCHDPWCTVCSPVREAVPRANWHPATTTATTTSGVQPKTLPWEGA